MKAEDKAKELVNKFYKVAPQYVKQDKDGCLEYTKQCALIAVDEILNCGNDNDGYINCDKTYWQEVKQHLTHL